MENKQISFISSNRGRRKKRLLENRHNFYLSFFSGESKYEEKEINGFWLVKSWNPEKNCYQASLFDQESFSRYKLTPDTAVVSSS